MLNHRWLFSAFFVSLSFLGLSSSGAWAENPPPAPAPPSVPAGPPADAPPVNPAGPPAGYFYYCSKSNAYYPVVSTCEDSWIAIPASPPAPRRYRGYMEPPSPPDTAEQAVVSRPTSLSLSLFGQALAYSIDLDHAFSEHVSLGAGFSTWDSWIWWNSIDSRVTVVPIYLNYYFSQNPGRFYLTGGVDWINVSQGGYSSNTFANDGWAASIGAGYEDRSNSGFLFRIGGCVIIGQSTMLNPSVAIGYSF